MAWKHTTRFYQMNFSMNIWRAGYLISERVCQKRKEKNTVAFKGMNWWSVLTLFPKSAQRELNLLTHCPLPLPPRLHKRGDSDTNIFYIYFLFASRCLFKVKAYSEAAIVSDGVISIGRIITGLEKKQNRSHALYNSPDFIAGVGWTAFTPAIDRRFFSDEIDRGTNPFCKRMWHIEYPWIPKRLAHPYWYQHLQEGEINSRWRSERSVETQDSPVYRRLRKSSLYFLRRRSPVGA